jgi:hypothetical protein
MVPFRSLRLAACLVFTALAQAALAQHTIDLRNCPLDTITYKARWGPTTFSVKRVATYWTYLCGKSGVVDAPISGEQCSGPYGTTTLLGEFRDHFDRVKPLIAEYEAIKGVPCCRWMTRSAKASEILGTAWLQPGAAPLLGDHLRFLTIDNSNQGGGLDPGPEVIDMSAFMCTLREEAFVPPLPRPRPTPPVAIACPSPSVELSRMMQDRQTACRVVSQTRLRNVQRAEAIDLRGVKHPVYYACVLDRRERRGGWFAEVVYVPQSDVATVNRALASRSQDEPVPSETWVCDPNYEGPVQWGE